MSCSFCNRTKLYPLFVPVVLVFITVILLGCPLVTPTGGEFLDSLISRLETLGNAYPELVTLDIIGNAAGPRQYPILRVVITGTSGAARTVQAASRPKLLLLGALHGDEPLSADIAVLLAEHLASEYGSDPAVTELLNTLELHIVPVVNPWGMVNGYRRTYAGVDINRDFGLPDPDLAASPENPDWFHPWTGGFEAAESLVLRNLCEEERYIAGIQGHTGAENINIPMDYLAYLDNPNAGENFLEKYIPIYPLMKKFADLYTQLAIDNGLPAFYTTEGGDWYIVDGSFTDWHFGALGAPGFTIEYDERKGVIPDSASAWNAHREALLSILGIARHRVYGKVIDSFGLPMSERLDFIPVTASRDPGDPTPLTLSVLADADSGDYHILLPEGTWDVFRHGDKIAAAQVTVDNEGISPPPCRLDIVL